MAQDGVIPFSQHQADRVVPSKMNAARARGYSEGSTAARFSAIMDCGLIDGACRSSGKMSRTVDITTKAYGMPRKEPTSDQLMGLLELAARIRRVRRHYELTQEAFSGKLGVSRSHLSEVEGQKAKPAVEMVLGIAVAFPEVRGDWLVSGEGPMLEAQDDELLAAEVSAKLSTALAMGLADEIDDDIRRERGAGLSSHDKVNLLLVLPDVFRAAYVAAKTNPGTSHRDALKAATRKARRVAQEIAFT